MNAAMRRALSLTVTALTIAVTPVSAQMAPMAAGPGAAPGATAPWPGNPPPCIAEFMKLRGVVEKQGMAAKALQASHPTREAMCKAIQIFAAAEEKMVSYADANASGCGIPPDAIKQMKGGHAKTMQIRQQICSAGPTAAPAAPTLSDALGVGPSPMQGPKTSKGTFDTLTGNALTR